MGLHRFSLLFHLLIALSINDSFMERILDHLALHLEEGLFFLFLKHPFKFSQPIQLNGDGVDELILLQGLTESECLFESILCLI